MPDFQSILPYLAAISAFALAAMVIIRDFKSFIHQILALGLAMLAAESMLTGFCLNSATPLEASHWMNLRNVPAALLPGSWYVFTLCFSASRPMGLVRKWWWAVFLLFAAPVSILVGAGGSLYAMLPVSTPSGFWASRVNTWGMAFQICTLTGAGLSLFLIERTLKHSTGNFRWQIKFLMFGMGCILAARIFTVGQTLLFHAVRMEWELVNAVAIISGVALSAKALLRMYTLNVKFYVSNSVVYNSLSVILIGVYFIVVSLTAKFFFIFDAANAISFASFFLIASIAGIIAMLFSDRYRKKAKRFISRHFKRPIYDYRKEWAGFTHETSSALDLHALSRSAARIVSDTFDALAVNIWIKDRMTKDVVLGASTIFSETGQSLSAAAQKLVAAVEDHKIPFDLDYVADERPEPLQGLGEDFLETLEMRYCIPLRVKEDLVGVMTLGKRVGDAPLSVEDFDLLSTMADQFAANAMNISLSERLRDLKQMEAFQNMSAFFVHDLKNLANKLSLTVQNLPRHFEDPDFRKDAVKSISKSVEKIKLMSTRLSSLSQKIDLRMETVDLNALISKTVADLNGAVDGRMVQTPGQIPTVKMDPAHFSKVMTNLLMNAIEASNGDGKIEIASGKTDDWVFVSVRDHGQGMTADHIQQSLFRPFRTTKQNGMGIGLYHSKTIVEAHGGKIEVESEVGVGSTFRVLLPCE